VGELRGVFAGWAAAPLARRVRGAGAGGAGAEAARTRHAGVLGLAALVGAYPYDVPPWMPDVRTKPLSAPDLVFRRPQTPLLSINAVLSLSRSANAGRPASGRTLLPLSSLPLPETKRRGARPFVPCRPSRPISRRGGRLAAGRAEGRAAPPPPSY
jgi:hypothetical protein